MSARALRLCAALLWVAVSGALMGQSCGPAKPAASTASDSDGDLVPDWCDNCRLAANRSQRDAQGDGHGDACDCDFDQNGVCNIDDFNAFLVDRGAGAGAGADAGSGTDMNGDGAVDDADFALFEPLYAAGAPGPGAVGASVVDGSCPASDPTCSDAFRPGACFDQRVSAAPDGTARPWRLHAASDGCDFDPQLLIDAGFRAAALNPNNPTDAWVAEATGGAVRCPNAAFATFPEGAVCDATRACDPRDHRKLCGAPDGRGGVVACGDTAFARACELHDACLGQCGYREYECNTQYRRNLLATCEALSGEEALGCYDGCVVFANLYADQIDVLPNPGPGVWSEADLARQQELCTCCPGPGANGAPPAVCGDGVCDAASESCQPSSCPADCGSCTIGAACLADGDCAVGRCGVGGLCEPKPAGAACRASADCASGLCSGGVCQPACGDGSCDGGETCGSEAPDACAADCGQCLNTVGCFADGDCASGACVSGACLGLAPVAPCFSSAQCASGICDFNYCVDEPRDAGEACGLDLACKGQFEGITRTAGPAGLCDLGFCAPSPKPPGAACGRDAVCEAHINLSSSFLIPPVGVCNLGVCLRDPLAAGEACDDDRACASQICNLGVCIDTALGAGEACDGQAACGGALVCAGGTCKKVQPEPCSSGAECASGICRPAPQGDVCEGICGDGICEGNGNEICGQDDLVTCRSDCGECDLIGRGIASTLGVCLYNEDCPSGICNFGVCIPGPNGPGTLCTTNAACWSGVCNFGFCVERTVDEGSPCTTNEVCASGACNFGICIASGSRADGLPCTTGAACAGGACNFSLCDRPQLDGGLCSHDGACLSGACNLGVCVSEGAVGEGLPCTSDLACASEFCAGLIYEPGKLPLPGICAARCGDGQCGALETCGFTNVLARCPTDCGQCAAGALCLSRFDCQSGICDFGLCSDGGEPNGSVCQTNGVCASGICNFGFCIGAPQAAGVPCTTDAACRSGDCTAGFCIQRCNDGFCDGLEKCGDVNAGLECTVDCGLCGNGALCVSNADCTSGICNFGFCIGGNLPSGSPCTTSLACRSGTCTAGLCIQRCGDAFCDGVEKCGDANAGLECTTDCGRCGNGAVCISNGDCASNACNFGICASNLPNGTPCSTSNACSSGRCLAGLCAPQTFCGDLSCNGGETCSTCTLDCGPCCKLIGAICTSNGQCCSGVCIGNPFGADRCL